MSPHLVCVVLEIVIHGLVHSRQASANYELHPWATWTFLNGHQKSEGSYDMLSVASNAYIIYLCPCRSWPAPVVVLDSGRQSSCLSAREFLSLFLVNLAMHSISSAGSSALCSYHVDIFAVSRYAHMC